MSAPLLSVSGLTKTFRSGGRHVLAVDDISFELAAGQTLGIVGASGSGKSTLARLLMRLIPTDAGEIRFQGQDWLALSGGRLRRARSDMQMVFQDPLSAFNPRATVESALADPLRIHEIVAKAERSARIEALLEKVGLSPSLRGRSVLALSGGQRQRLALARALATRPKLLILDEAVSALDLSIRRQVLELLVSLQREDGVSCLFIGHDLAVMRAIAHRVAVMEAGRIVESGETESVIAHPQSSVTKALIAAVPQLTTGAESRPG